MLNQPVGSNWGPVSTPENHVRFRLSFDAGGPFGAHPSRDERLESHVQTDLVAVLEGIGDGFGDAVHTHCLAFDAVSLDAYSQCLSTNAHNT
jgi:hypothetical protein